MEEKISDDLEKKIIELLSQKRYIEAVTIVHIELKLTLQESKDIVDKYRK